MNRDVQRIIDSPEYRRLFPSTQLWGKNVRSVADGSYLRNSDLFEVVGHRGYYMGSASGVPLPAWAAEFCPDDPVKNRKEANSATYRQAVWEWYTSTFYTRLAPGGNILLIVTRWHEDDLAGRLLAAAKSDPDADQWTVITLPAVAEEPVARTTPASRARCCGRSAGTRRRCGASGRSWASGTGQASTSSGHRQTKARSSSGTTGATGSQKAPTCRRSPSPWRIRQLSR